jgi:NADH-ubiquinone oxidoreductase chain 6
MSSITNFILSFGILFSAFSIISLGNNPVLAVVLLIITFVLSAIYLILMGINFIGITYIILYVGAIAVLFLFVIMMLNLKDKDLIETSSVTYNNFFYSIISVFFLAFIFSSLSLIPLRIKNISSSPLENLVQLENSNINISYEVLKDLDISNKVLNFKLESLNLDSVILEEINKINADTKLYDFTQIETLGQDLYTYGAVLLISLSFILLLAMFATIIISKANATNPSEKK